MKEEETSSAGKVYVISLKSKESYTVMQPERVDFYGVPCVKSKNVRVGNWLEGKTVLFPVDNIGYILEFSSYEDCKVAEKKYYDERGNC